MSAGEEVIIVVSQVCNAIAVSQKNSSESWQQAGDWSERGESVGNPHATAREPAAFCLRCVHPRAQAIVSTALVKEPLSVMGEFNDISHVDEAMRLARSTRISNG
jgi:hypothetical protein